MDDITLTPASGADLAKAAHWASFDSPTSRLLKVHEHSVDVPDIASHYWIGMVGSEPVGLVSLRIDRERIGHLDLVVSPSHRRQGVGNTLLQKALTLPEIKISTKVRTVAKLDNIAAQKVLRDNGFHQLGPSSEGVVYERRV
ncbi:hypothetical protein A3D14_02845 [Candidatus Saccharibacteria bacterium RIFCSPHIGHO2_02_FULL_47_12]|nr:MAG: hypothetical protein A3D14_02845 [Candidatus Saccharibacteria bacterium RIFCSPHIGHO2_02_FULL_47_12]